MCRLIYAHHVFTTALFGPYDYFYLADEETGALELYGLSSVKACKVWSAESRCESVAWTVFPVQPPLLGVHFPRTLSGSEFTFPWRRVHLVAVITSLTGCYAHHCVWGRPG